ncbi:NUDIX hydrolase [Dyadobacter arcticus]|uniref:8-oxo-dGTP pyrophosphatase MutT (NUDIX family) n=1 Tax=Dyadobacter arcticus TaxID=1078754 RepID=A0ABX0UHK4_9BACT|nr:NUDIX hydrolase [Dyadobacter arcticus]NIJ51973.1 8-oxo-dGTP pyrophosphatase MutT (NUDIX family) [Dyadobacter arcticus]
MIRDRLIALLKTYIPETGEEEQMHRETIAFVKENPECFERTLLIGHVTASGWVLSANKNEVLLMHHRKLDRWFQPGGHCDGDPDVEAVARKEVWEETGIQHLELLKRSIYDIDVHLIPANNDIPAHHHYDIRFVFQMIDEQTILINSESRDVRWIPLAEVHHFHDSESIMRMVRKTSAL